VKETKETKCTDRVVWTRKR